MHNPFVQITPALLQAMMASPKLFVRQHFPRGKTIFDDDDMMPLLFTYYEKTNEVEANRANIHMAQINEDPYRFLYDSDQEDHRRRLMNACAASPKYTIYINLLHQQWVPPTWLRRKLHAYMLTHFYWWHYSKTHQLHIHLKDRYGQLYLHLSWKANTADLLLDELENFPACVTT
jgi:hypothetical protein